MDVTNKEFRDYYRNMDDLFLRTTPTQSPKPRRSAMYDFREGYRS